MNNPFKDIDKDIWKSFVNKPREPRKYIGASILGHECDRRIWLDWKGIVDKQQFAEEEKQGQKFEIFHRGNEEEEIFIKKLLDAGYTVKDRQAAFSEYDGKLQGHCDGIIVDPEGHEYLFEFKTMMETSFRKAVKDGLKKTHPHYVTQIQLYMWFLNFNPEAGIKKALIVCQNKNRDYERHYEIHMIDPQHVIATLSKLERILSYEDQMPGLLCAPDYPSYICKMCDYFKFCYSETK